MCACDGIEPTEALSRSRGGYRREVTALAAQRKRRELPNRSNESSKKKKRKSNSHFKKIGKIRNPIVNSTPSRTTNTSKKKKDDSDSDFNIEEESTSVNENSTVVASIVEEQLHPANDNFTLEIENNECSIIDNNDDDDISLTIAEKIVNSRTSTKQTLISTTNQGTKTKTTGNSIISTKKRAHTRGKKDLLVSKKQNSRRSKSVSVTNKTVEKPSASTRAHTRGKKDLLVSKKQNSRRSKSVSVTNKTVEKPSASTSVTTKSSTLEELLNNLHLPSHWIRLIPSFRIRENATRVDDSASKQSYLRFMSLGSKVINQSIKLLCPGPGYNQFKSELISKEYVKVSEENGSIQKNKNTKSNPKDTNMNSFKRTSSEKLGSVVSTLCKWSNISKKRSVERRVIRAILNESFLRHEIKEMKDGEHKLRFGNGQPVSQAQNDGMLLRVGKKLNLKTITRQYKTDAIIKKCVDFILSDQNISSVSWGSKTVLSQSIGEITLPKLTRKCEVSQMYRKYKELTINDTDRLKVTSFYTISNVLTTNDEAMLQSIDYVSGLLGNETCETLQDIVDKLVPTNLHRKCTNYITIAKNFIKNQFKNQIMQEDDCCFHSLQYALCKDMPLRENTNDNACKFPFYVCDYIKFLVNQSDDHTSTSSTTTENSNINLSSARTNETTATNDGINQPTEIPENVREDATNVIDAIKEKFRLFLSHQARCQCQSVAISSIEDEIKELCSKSNGKVIKALIIMDFKMKFESRSSRETTVEHYGKRGIGWHGFAVIFYLLGDSGEPYKNIIYFDQILSDDNAQDALTVVGLLEIMISTIISELPYIKEAVVTSDNASCYQNHFVTFMMALLNKKFNGQFFIESFQHSETQDGKSLLDAHFATSNRHLVTFMKTWRDNRVTRINTAKGLSHALSFNIGLKNSIIQLIELDRAKLEELKDIFSNLTKQCGEYYSRVNCIKFDKTSNDGWDKNNKDHMHEVQRQVFTYTVRAYSNINPEVKCNVSLIEDKFDIDNDANSSSLECMPSDPDESEIPNNNRHDPIEHNEVEGTTDSVSDFSSFRVSKANFLQQLEVVGAFSLLSIHPKAMIEQQQMDDVTYDNSDSDSDYNDEENEILDNDDDVLDDFFLSEDDGRTYGEPPMAIFAKDLMITGTKVVRWLPLGAIRQKKATANKQRKLSHKQMICGVADRALVYAKNNIVQNNTFLHRNEIDPITNEAADYKIEPFESGWAKRKGHGKSYGVSYITHYEDDLKRMFQVGMKNSANKMNAGKMRDNLINLYPGRFSIPGETQIKQFIGKLAQQEKDKDKQKNKKRSGRGRKAGGIKSSWHPILVQIVEDNPKEKPEVIYNSFINMFSNDNLPDDLPLTPEDEPDKEKIKSTIARFKTNIRKKEKRSIIE